MDKTIQDIQKKQDTKERLVELKAAFYDCQVQIEQAQQIMRQINQEIASLQNGKPAETAKSDAA